MNIEQYSKQDLIHIFGLKPNYTMYELEENTYKLFNKLIHQYDKSQVDVFLEQAKYYLTPVQQTPFIYTQSDNYFKGELNPIEKRVITRGICIDTLFRPNYFKTSSSVGSSSTVVKIVCGSTGISSMFQYDFPVISLK